MTTIDELKQAILDQAIAEARRTNDPTFVNGWIRAYCDLDAQSKWTPFGMRALESGAGLLEGTDHSQPGLAEVGKL